MWNLCRIVLIVMSSISTIASAASIESYVNGFHSIPNVDTKHILPKEVKNQSIGFRTVVDPVVLRRKADEVSFLPSFRSLNFQWWR